MKRAPLCLETISENPEIINNEMKGIDLSIKHVCIKLSFINNYVINYRL